MVNNKVNTTMSILLVVVFSVFKVNCQNAEKLFDAYYKFGVVGQFNVFKEANVSPTNNSNLGFDIFKSKAFAVGIAYNVYQYKKWNFKAELQLQWFGDNKSLVILEPENVVDFDYRDFSSTEYDKMGYLPLTAEYVFLKTGSLNFSIGGGIGITYYWHYDVEGSSGLAIDNIILFEAYEINNYPLFYLSNHLEASIYLNSKAFLLQTSLIFKKSHESFKKGTYNFTNLKLSPDVNGSFEQSGDFLGIRLAIYPKKRESKVE